MTESPNGISGPLIESTAQKSTPDLCHIRKLKSVLSKLIDPKFKISDDTILEKLFTHLSQRCASLDEKTKLAEMAIYVPWLCIVKKLWENLGNTVRGFALRVAGLVGSVPTGFFTLYESEILKSLCTFVTEDKNTSLIVTLCYSEMLQSIIVHSSGLHWVIESGVWKNMVDLVQSNKSIYTSRSATRFICTLIITLETSDINICHTILDTVLEPLSDCTPPSDENAGAGSNKEQPPRDIVISTLKLSSEIVLALLNAKLPPARVNSVIERYKLEDWAWLRLHEESTDIELITCTSKLLCLLHMTTVSRTEKDEIYYSVMRSLTLLALRHLHVAILKHFFTLVLDICVEYQILWHNYGGKIIYTADDRKNDVFDIENNLIITQAMPTFICMKVTRVMESDVMDLFAEKVFSLSCLETQRICYAYRDCLRESTDRSLEALCLQGVLSFSRVTQFLKREQAVMAFQCMMHTLKEFVPEEVSDISADCIVARRHTQSLVTRFPSILSSLLDGLTKYISAFCFTWRDSLETVCILNFLQGLFTNPNISSLLCAKALQLTRLVIVGFIPPNLALLVDTLQGSSIGDLGKQLFKKLHDIHWEVRDSALEVLQAIASIADAKFPAFQTLLIENDIPRVVVSLATGDSEPYVRASAMCCLQEMVKVQTIWESTLYNQKLLDKLLKMLENDTEGIVRHKAALLVSEIYRHQTVPNSALERIYDTMCHIAVQDLHWEVKIGALDFWAAVIEKNKMQEGMIDGVFPEVTFSCQARKIVTLDPPEIRNRLVRILNNLSNAGCLYALWKTLNDECDLQVIKASLVIIKPLMELLGKYDLPKMMDKDTITLAPVYQIYTQKNFPIDHKADLHEEEEEVEEEVTDGSKEKLVTMSTDEVIEEIVNEVDINLLSSKILHDKSKRTTLEVKPRSILPSSDFVSKILSINLDELVKEKSRWISATVDDVDSLFEDILAINSQSEPDQNSIDCY